ncbi:MAG: hypothetical protein ACYC9X_10180 [Dehalococcoidia bacterium]
MDAPIDELSQVPADGRTRGEQDGGRGVGRRNRPSPGPRAGETVEAVVAART